MYIKYVCIRIMCICTYPMFSVKNTKQIEPAPLEVTSASASPAGSAMILKSFRTFKKYTNCNV